MGQLIAFSLISCLILFLCYLIKYKKQASIIAGYDEDRVVDKNGLCNWIGNIMTVPGISAIITGISLWLWPEWELPIALLFGLITTAASIIAAAGGRKFMKKA